MKQKKIHKLVISALLAMSLELGIALNVNATSGYAYSMGGLSTSVQQIINTANNWALCGYTSYYNTDITYSYLSSSSVLNSDVLYFSGPGGQNAVKLESSLYLISGSSNGSTQVGLSGYTLSNTRLVVFNAGYTASNTSNICTAARNSGADAAIGWKSTLTSDDSTLWQSRFQSYLVSGHKVHISMDYADSFSDYDSNTDTKNHLVYGNWTQYISLYVNVLPNDDVQEEQSTRGDERVVPIQEITCNYDDVTIEDLENAISAYDSDFDAADYELSVASTSEDNTSFVVDVTKKIGDFSTSSGYTFIFHDNRAGVMYDNTINSDDTELRDSTISEKADRSVNEAYLTAAADKEDGYYITSQTAEKYCNLETGRFYNKVLTECKEINGECYYSYSTLVPIA